MSLEDTDATTTANRRPRPVQPKRKRSYMAEIAAAEKERDALQARIATAVRLLKRAVNDGGASQKELIAVAISELQGGE